MEVIKLVEKLNAPQQVTTSLTSPTVNMMPNGDRCFVCGKTSNIHCHCPNTQCYNCKDFGHFTWECPDRIPPSGTPHHHNRSCFLPHYDHNCRDRSQSLNYKWSQERCLTNQDHTADPTMAEVPATIGEMHPISYPTTAAACDTHQPANALGDTLDGTHLRHATFPNAVTLETTLCYKASILPAAIHPKTVDGSPMSSLGKANLHLQIADLSFCTPSSFATDYQKPIFSFASLSRKGILYLIAATQTDSYSYRKEVYSWPTLETKKNIIISQW